MMRPRLTLAVLALAGAACATPDLVAPTDTSNNAVIFDALWTEFDLHYSFFQVKSVNWDSMRTVYRPRAIEAPNGPALAKVLTQMLGGLRDRHVSLATSGAPRAISFLSHSDSVTPPVDVALIERRYVKNAARSTGGHVTYALLTPTVGYLRIPTFQERGWLAELDAALTSLSAAQSLIVDVRSNPGGAQATAVEAAGRFATSSQVFAYAKFRNGPGHGDFTALQPQTVSPTGSSSFRGRVILLTDRRVYSSGEDFVLAMHALPTVTTMGDTTAGASGRPMTRELPNGWTYQLSTWVAYTLDHKIFENIGLAPDVYVPSTASDRQAGVDPVLERAMQTLGAKGS